MVDAPAGLPTRYRVERLLGKGGQARTYLAEDAQTGERVALKVFELRDAESWKGYDLFERECRVLRSLEHPHVVRYIEHGGSEEHGVFFLAMEYAEGPTLDQRMRDGRRFTDAQLAELLRELLRTLAYLHSLNPPVFHRDIKPANVVLTAGSGVKLVDFGGVRDVFSDRAHSTVVGTFGYMAPEQMRGEATPASDLYGLGATIAAVATGIDAAALPHTGLELDLERCIKPGRIREVLRELLRADPRARVTEATRALALLEGRLSVPAAERASVVPRTHDELREVESLARDGQEIAAIRRYRELTGASLREARSAIKALVALPPTTRELVLSDEDQVDVNRVAFGLSAVAGLLGLIVTRSPVGLVFAVIAFPVVWWFVRNVFRGYRADD